VRAPFEGSDKREPFSETTKTFSLSATAPSFVFLLPFAPGPIAFSHQRKKPRKKLSARFVKSKNYRS